MIELNNYLHEAWDNAPSEITKQQHLQDIQYAIYTLQMFYQQEYDRPEPPPTPDQQAIRTLKDILMKIFKPHEI